MKVAHAHLSEIARVILVEVDAVVVLATRVSATAWVLALLANAAVPRRDVSAEVTVLLEASCHCGYPAEFQQTKIKQISLKNLQLQCICIYEYMCVYIYMCMCIYIYIYINIFIYMHI